MLTLKETEPTERLHSFKLSSIGIDERISFNLTCESYPDVNLEFTIQSEKFSIPKGYSVDVYLFKNQYCSQQDIIDLRINKLNSNKGRIGYFFRLDALFELDAIQLNQHTFPYAYYALEYIFSNGVDIQTKDVEITEQQYEIKDFYDKDTIILVLCNEYSSKIDNFKLDNYLASLFLFGFVCFGKTNGLERFNDIEIIEKNYKAIKEIVTSDGVYILQLPASSSIAKEEFYISHLFRNLIQKKGDGVTRFIMLYQIIEILISKIFYLEIKVQICDNLENLDSFSLKEILYDLQKEKSKIVLLLNTYSNQTRWIQDGLRNNIIEFFQLLGESTYDSEEKVKKFTLADVFYDYRNKLVHNYRLIHNPSIDNVATQNKMELINCLTEIFCAEIVSNFKD